MARKNRKQNREAAAEANKASSAEQLEFFDEMTDEDINPDFDEGEDTDTEEETNIDETAKASEAEEAGKQSVSDPSVKTGKEEGKEAEVLSLGDEEDGEDEGEEGDEAGKPKTEPTPEVKPDEKKPEELTPEPKPDETKKEEEKKSEEKTPEEIAAAKAAEEAEAAKPKPVSDEEAAELFTKWRSETESLLATHHYALTQAQIEEYEDNPAALIPKLMSKVYMDSISAAFNQFTNYLPRMVNMVVEQREQMNSAEKSFFDRWPDLLQHRDTVLRLGMSYRQSNPQASMEDFINEVGAQTMVALRLNPANGNGTGAITPSSMQPAPAPAFKPAVSSPGPAPTPKPKPTNVFEQLASEFDEFEEEIDTN